MRSLFIAYFIASSLLFAASSAPFRIPQTHAATAAEETPIPIIVVTVSPPADLPDASSGAQTQDAVSPPVNVQDGNVAPALAWGLRPGDRAGLVCRVVTGKVANYRMPDGTLNSNHQVGQIACYDQPGLLANAPYAQGVLDLPTNYRGILNANLLIGPDGRLWAYVLAARDGIDVNKKAQTWMQTNLPVMTATLYQQYTSTALR